jgi:tetratricopeptide (TPR) repeat protein
MRLVADEMIADAQIHLNNFDIALSRLQPYIDRAKADPDHFGDVLLQVEHIQILTNHSDQAANLLRPLLAKSTPARLDWIKLAAAFALPDREAQWLREVEPFIPADGIAEWLGLIEQWQSLAKRSNSADYHQKAVDEAKQFVHQCAAHANAVQLLVLGSLQENLGDVDDAQTSYRAVLRLDPNALIAQNNLAMLLAKSGHLDEALVYAQKVTQTDGPYQADFQETLAYVQDRLGRHEDAIKTLVSALRISPNHVPSLIELSSIYASAGQMDQARSIFQQLQQLAPDAKTLTPDLQAKLASLRQVLYQ